MNRKPNTTKMVGLYVYRQDGTVVYLKYKALKRPKKWKAASTKKPARRVIEEADEQIPPLLRKL